MSDRAKTRAYEAFLVAAARAGERAAFAELVERWQPRMLAHAWRLTGEAELARDLAQEAWLEIWRGLGRLEDAGAFPAWALQILTRRCSKALRRKQRQRDGEAVLAREPATATVSAAAEAERGAELRQLREAIAGLPGPQRAALALFYSEGLRVAEIAIALDVPVGTVKTRLMQARRKLRATLEDGESDD